MRSSAEGVRSPLLVELQAGVEDADAVPLFCIHPMGGGSMGYRDLAQALGPEQPGSWVYLAGLSVDFLERRTHRVHGAEVESQRFSRDCFLAAVREYPGCFRWRPAAAGVRPRPERVCDDATLAEYRLQSRLHEHLVDSTLRQIPEPSPRRLGVPGMTTVLSGCTPA